MPRTVRCPIASTLDVVGDRWTLLVVRDLLRGKRRFAELKASAEGIPGSVLSDRLKMLEDQGVILTAGRKGTFVRQGATNEVAKVKASRAQSAMRRVVERLLIEGLSREEISDVFARALRAGRSKG